MPGWFETLGSRPDLPSWLQAFAAFVALFVSVWAVRRADAIQRKRDRLQALGIAAAIYPEILGLEATLGDVRNHFDNILESVRGGVPNQATGASVLNGQILLPPLIDRNIEHLFLLGKNAGPSCLQLVNSIFQFNAFVTAMAARSVMMDIRQWEADVDRLLEQLQLLQSIIAKCKKEVAGLRDQIM
jgi:hypothetical protein